MKRYTIKHSPILIALVTSLLGIANTAIQAAPGTLSSTPLFLSSAVKPNIMLVIDDSGSMDMEVVAGVNDGSFWWNTSSTGNCYRSFAGCDKNDASAPGILNFNKVGNWNSTWIRYGYLFPNGSGSASTARRLFADGAASSYTYALPPNVEYAFARNAYYNTAYYDPTVNYDPWSSYPSYTFPNATATAARWDPWYPTSGTFTVDLTTNRTSSASDETFHLAPGMRNPSSGAVVSSATDVGITYYPATYYNRITSAASSYTLSGDSAGTYPCSTLNPAHYNAFVAGLVGVANTTGTGVLSGMDALGPDGACLKKVEIKSTTASYTIPAARSDCDNSTTCTYAQEIQNFANWFTYYRKRHQAMRGGIATAFHDLSGIRAGMFGFNTRPSTTTSLSMLDFDTAGSKDTFFSGLQAYVSASSTPTRSSLKYAGDQFKRTDASAPILSSALGGSCQKNFSIVFTDGYAVVESISGIANDDGSSGSPYQDSYSDTLGDIAMYYYANNLRTDLTAGKVPVPTACAALASGAISPLDCKKDPHMNTFGVVLGADGNMYGVTKQSVNDPTRQPDAYTLPYPVWQNPSTDRDPVQIDDLFHATVNGRGEMLTAETPKAITTKMQQVLSTIQERNSTASAASFSTTQLQAGSQLFKANFDSSAWSGALNAFSIDSSNGNVSSSAVWSASVPTTATNRVILTYNQTTATGVPFRWDTTKLSATQQSDLGAATLPTKCGVNNTVACTAADRLNYLRGDRTYEGTAFRKRDANTLLGDVVHSTPVNVAEPQLSWPGTSPFPTGAAAYSTFKASLITTPRLPVLYVGSNDGMLHGFRTDQAASSTTNEVLAFVPSSLSSETAGIHALTDPAYTHNYYVDLSPTVSDVYLNSAWHTVLVGGFQSGGKGYFALDVTNPSNFTEANANSVALWEFTSTNTSANNGDVGYSYAKPTIAMMNNGKWAAIFGNGYNSTNGHAVLFIAYLNKPAGANWSKNTDYIAIDTGVGSTSDLNGMSTVTAVDMNGDSVIDRIYAGDLKGNMWVFDVSSATDSSWAVAYSGKALFTAKIVTGNGASAVTTYQPITTRPLVVKHPDIADDFSTTGSSNNQPNVMVLFGTGQYLTDADKSTTSTQTYYGVYDNGALSKSSQATLLRADLVAQSVNESWNTNVNIRVPSSNTVNYTNKFGWYMDLTESKERVAVDAFVRNKLVFFNTMTPSTVPCDPGGTSWLMALNISNGGRPDKPAFDVTHNNVVDNSDFLLNGTVNEAPGGIKLGAIANQSGVLGDYQYTTESDDTLAKDKIVPGNSASQGRLGWHELRQ